MDLLDKKILDQLDQNCRKSFAHIARNVRSSKAVVLYRVKRLERQGIIKKYLLSLNLGKLGFSTYKLYFKLWNYDEEAKKEWTNYLLGSPSVIHVIKTDGAFDFSIVIAVKGVTELDDFISELKNKFSRIIRDYRLSIIVSTKIFGRAKLLLGKVEQNPKIEVFSAPAEKFELDEKDRSILFFLSEDASQPILSLAKKTGLSVDIVKYRMKKLLKEGIINSFRILFDTNRLGYYHYVFLMNVKKSTPSDVKKLITWAQLSKNIIYITKRVGFWDYEIHVALKNIDEYEFFSSDFEKEFSEIISSYETLIQQDILKLTYFPYSN